MMTQSGHMEPSPAAFSSAVPRSYDDTDYELHEVAEAEREATEDRDDLRAQIESLRAKMDALLVRLTEADNRVKVATVARELAVSAKLRYDFHSWLEERKVLVGTLPRCCAITGKFL